MRRGQGCCGLHLSVGCCALHVSASDAHMRACLCAWGVLCQLARAVSSAGIGFVYSATAHKHGWVQVRELAG